MYSWSKKITRNISVYFDTSYRTEISTSHHGMSTSVSCFKIPHGGESTWGVVRT